MLYCLHFSAGVGRTGVFVTLSIVLGRMRYEAVVDMFQTVKVLRTQRPAMVQNEVRSFAWHKRYSKLFLKLKTLNVLLQEQYSFCYGAALEYLGSFDHYGAT